MHDKERRATYVKSYHELKILILILIEVKEYLINADLG